MLVMWINTSRIIVFVSGAPATVIYEIGSATHSSKSTEHQKRDAFWIMERMRENSVFFRKTEVFSKNRVLQTADKTPSSTKRK